MHLWPDLHLLSWWVAGSTGAVWATLWWGSQDSGQESLRYYHSAADLHGPGQPERQPAVRYLTVCLTTYYTCTCTCRACYSTKVHAWIACTIIYNTWHLHPYRVQAGTTISQHWAYIVPCSTKHNWIDIVHVESSTTLYTLALKSDVYTYCMYMYICLHWHTSYILNSTHSLHRLRKEYEVIADKALTTPTDTEHLMTLKEEIVKVVETTLPELETRIIEARHRYIHVHIWTHAQLALHGTQAFPAFTRGV